MINDYADLINNVAFNIDKWKYYTTFDKCRLCVVNMGGSFVPDCYLCPLNENIISTVITPFPCASTAMKTLYTCINDYLHYETKLTEQDTFINTFTNKKDIEIDDIVKKDLMKTLTDAVVKAAIARLTWIVAMTKKTEYKVNMKRFWDVIQREINKEEENKNEHSIEKSNIV